MKRDENGMDFLFPNRDECFLFQSDFPSDSVHILTYSMYKKSNIKKENRNENGMKRDENGSNRRNIPC